MDILPLLAHESNHPLKKCTKCLNYYPATLEFFHKGKSKKDGLYAACKACRSQRKTPKVPVPEGMKRCYACKQLFPATPDFFSRNTNKKDMFCCECKTCAAESKKQWGQRDSAKASRKRYRLEHREEMRKWQKQHYQSYKEEFLAYQKEYRELNKDEISTRRKIYRENNRARLLENKRQYYKTPHGRMIARVHRHRRRAQERAAGGTYTAAQLQDLMKRQKHRCYWCQNKLGKGKNSYHADHVVPLSRDGSNDISNIVIACPACNLKKQNKLPHEWAEGGRLL